MDTFEAIYQRRAVKHYDPDHEFTDDEINKLMEAAIQSPTSFNIQNWRFVLVRDKELRKKIRVAAWDVAFVWLGGSDDHVGGKGNGVRLLSYDRFRSGAVGRTHQIAGGS